MAQQHPLLCTMYSVLGVVQLFSHIQLLGTPWTSTRQATLSFTISWRLLKSCPLSQWMMPSNHLILCRSLLLLPSIFPGIRVFSNESALLSCGQSIGASASTLVLPMNIQGLISFKIDWFDLPCSPRDSQESSPAPEFESINSSVLSLLYGLTIASIHEYYVIVSSEGQ